MKTRGTLLFLTLVLCACSRSIPAPIITPTYDGCAFVWANKDLPELSETLEKEIQALDRGSTARAVAFGENCVYMDGHSTFGAIETDFYITTTVTDISDLELFGNWISQTVPVVQSVSEAAAGPHLGFIEYTFKSNDDDAFSVRVPLEKYDEKVNGLSGENIFLLFYDQQ